MLMNDRMKQSKYKSTQLKKYSFLLCRDLSLYFAFLYPGTVSWSAATTKWPSVSARGNKYFCHIFPSLLFPIPIPQAWNTYAELLLFNKSKARLSKENLRLLFVSFPLIYGFLRFTSLLLRRFSTNKHKKAKLVRNFEIKPFSYLTFLGDTIYPQRAV